MNVLKKLCVALMLLCGQAALLVQAQGNDFGGELPRRVSGTVLDTNGEAVIGANVLVKGSKSGTITDFNGKFVLSLTSKDKIVVSYVGYDTQEISVGKNSPIRVILKENSRSLNDLVVIGYGAVKRSDLTTSISKMDSEAIQDRPLSNVAEALQGQLAGVQMQLSSGIPGEEAQIVIRGNSTLDGESKPLYVIDGVITETMSDLNPNDVASIQVLKDASATAIYGARGSAGVILIETKKAKEGKPTVTLDVYYGVQNADRMPQVMTGSEWYAYNIAMINASYIAKDSRNNMNIPNKYRPSGDQIPTDWLLNPNADTPDFRLNPNATNTDWLGAILQPGNIQSYQLSVSNRIKDKSSLNISGGYFSQDGIIKFTGFQRVNLRMSGTLNLNKKMTLGMTISPNASWQQRGESEGKDKVVMNALQTPPVMPMDKGTQELGWDQSNGGAQKNTVNPYERLKSVHETMNTVSVNSSAWFEYNIIKNLVFKSMGNFNYRNNQYEYYVPANVVAPNAVGGQKSSGSARLDNHQQWGWQNTLSYNLKFLKRNSMDFMIGQSIDSREYFRADLSANTYPLESVYTLNMATIPTNASTRLDVARTSSFFGRVGYNYDGKYLLNATVRADGSSRFGPSSRWGYFPSVSGAWKISGEDFLANNKVVNLLKVRVSWGLSGNDRIGYNDYLSTFEVGNAALNGSSVSMMYPKNFANPELKWESTESLNGGLDISLFNNRLQLNFDYYVSTTRDMLYNLKVPSTTGFTEIRTNLASLQNQGWELDINSVNINTGGFRWGTTLNLSQNSNKILYLGGNDDLLTPAWGAYFITKVGGPISQFYLMKTDGLLTEADFGVGADGKYDKSQPLVPTVSGQIPGNPKFIDTNNDGKITADDMTPYGSNLPDLTYGLTNRFSYKGIELSVLLQGQFGGNVLFLAARNLDTGRRTTNPLVRWLNHKWETYAGGDPIPSDLGIDMSWDGKTPQAYGFGQSGVNGNNDTQTITDQRIYDATYLRIKNVTLSYTLPEQWMKKVAIRRAKVYASVENLFTFTSYIGNPDVNSYASSNPILRGVDYTTYPTSKKYTIGLTFDF